MPTEEYERISCTCAADEIAQFPHLDPYVIDERASARGRQPTEALENTRTHDVCFGGPQLRILVRLFIRHQANILFLVVKEL